jgi:hypothetical protein
METFANIFFRATATGRPAGMLWQPPSWSLGYPLISE